MSAPCLFGLPPSGGADFSPCGFYRWRLWRRWSDALPILGFLMLNPSTADAIYNDPTVERCERRARSGEFGGLEVVNLFGYRSTDPKLLRVVGDPIGRENDAEILRAADRCKVLVAAWGTYGTLKGRDRQVIQLLRNAGHRLHVLALTKHGHPQHPLYVPYSVEPRLWSEAA